MNNKEYVLVYGSLREKMYNHRLIERIGKKLIANNIIIDGYTMKDLGAFPGLIKGDNKILCELYETTKDDIEKSFDRLEGYDRFNPKRSFYIREYVDLPNKIKVDDKEISKAYIYSLNQNSDITENNERYHSLDNVTKNEDGIQDWVKYKLRK